MVGTKADTGWLEATIENEFYDKMLELSLAYL